MQSIHFSMIFSGTVSPNGGDQEADAFAMTPGELAHNLEQAVCDITGKGLVTGDTPATLEDHSHMIRVTQGRFEMMAMPVISTAHLDAPTAKALAEAPASCRWATVASYGEGMFLMFLDEDGLDAEIPQCARDIRDWLKAQQLNGWVRLDRDYEIVDGLQTYDW